MKINWNWGAFFRALAAAFADLKENKSLPASRPVTTAELAAGARELQAWLPGFIATMERNPGMVRAGDDVLLFLAREGVTWAAPAEAAVDGAEGAAQIGLSILPWVIPWLGSAFVAAPTYQAGPVKGR